MPHLPDQSKLYLSYHTIPYRTACTAPHHTIQHRISPTIILILILMIVKMIVIIIVIYSYYIVLYPMPWKIQPIRGQDYRCIFKRYATGNMQRVVFHSTFLSLLARNSLLGSIWRLLKSQLRNSSTPANRYKHFPSRLVSEDFRTPPKISEDFPKILKYHKIIWKTLLNSFRSFTKISEDFRTLSKIFR